MDNVVTFIKRMVDPDVGSGATDVYGIMFGCQFIIFLIILFSWSAFAEIEVRDVLQDVCKICTSLLLRCYKNLRLMYKILQETVTVYWIAPSTYAFSFLA